MLAPRSGAGHVQADDAPRKRRESESEVEARYQFELASIEHKAALRRVEEIRQVRERRKATSPTTLIPQRSVPRVGVWETRVPAVLAQVEFRSEGAHDVVVGGYASLFDDPYDVSGGPTGNGWTEVVDRQAFRSTLAAQPDVVLTINHSKSNIPLARTTAGTLRLSTDSLGLFSEARLDRREPMARSIELAIEKGHLNEMSFAFRTVRQQWNPEYTQRRLLEVNLDKGDVSLVTHGANPNTRMGLVPALAAVSELTA